MAIAGRLTTNGNISWVATIRSPQQKLCMASLVSHVSFLLVSCFTLFQFQWLACSCAPFHFLPVYPSQSQHRTENTSISSSTSMRGSTGREPVNMSIDSKHFRYLFQKLIINTMIDIRYFHLQHSLDRIRKISSKVNSNDAFYGITEFSDMMPDEFHHFLLKSRSLKQSSYASSKLLSAPEQVRDQQLPGRVDWRERGIISHVRNQGKCGACWAYSTIQTIESMNALRLGTPVWPLSVQQVIDCASSVSSANRGCDGGDTCAALSWMKSTQVVLVGESEYPMRDSNDGGGIGQCMQSSSWRGVQVANFTCEEYVFSLLIPIDV